MRNNRTKIQRLALLGVLSAASVILSYVEAVLPPVFSAVPGVKVGLANIVVIFALYRIGFSAAGMLSLVRIAAVALLFGSPASFIYSMAGAALSHLVMTLLKKSDFFSEVGVSVAGGVSHNLGQILAAMLLLETPSLGYYMIVLSVTGTLAGLFIGLCGAFLIDRLPKSIL